MSKFGHNVAFSVIYIYIIHAKPQTSLTTPICFRLRRGLLVCVVHHSISWCSRFEHLFIDDNFDHNYMTCFASSPIQNNSYVERMWFASVWRRFANNNELRTCSAFDLTWFFRSENAFVQWRDQWFSVFTHRPNYFHHTFLHIRSLRRSIAARQQ